MQVYTHVAGIERSTNIIIQRQTQLRVHIQIESDVRQSCKSTIIIIAITELRKSIHYIEEVNSLQKFLKM